MKVKRGEARVVKGERKDGQSLERMVQLSNSDLVVPRVHVEVIYAFQGPVPSLNGLEEGLVTILWEYEEWAGRLSKDKHGRPAIALNNAGAVWIDAEADCSLGELMPFNPGWHLLELIPPNRGVDELLLVQVTKLSCGGITVGIARHHQVADGEAASNFMDAWVRAVKGLPPRASPFHDRSALMGNDPPQPKFEHVEYKRASPKTEADQPAEYPPLSVKKLHFSAEFLQNLKSRAVGKGEENGIYTTFESLTAHLWKCITKARSVADDVETKVIVAANGRRRFNPPISENYLGNVIFHACPLTKAKYLTESPLSFAAALVNNAIKRIDNEYMRSALDFMELQQKNPVQIARSARTILSPNISVTSWVQLPLYTVDFGWGAPIFAGPPSIPFEGLVMLIPSYTKDRSIDAVIGLFAPDMAKLEQVCYEA